MDGRICSNFGRKDWTWKYIQNREINVGELHVDWEVCRGPSREVRKIATVQFDTDGLLRKYSTEGLHNFKNLLTLG